MFSSSLAFSHPTSSLIPFHIWILLLLFCFCRTSYCYCSLANNPTRFGCGRRTPLCKNVSCHRALRQTRRSPQLPPLKDFHLRSMDYHDDYILIAYAISLCFVFLALILYRFRSEISRFKNFIRIPLLSHLVYRPVIRTKRIRHWSRADILALTAWLGVIGFCLAFKSGDVGSAGLRAAHMSILHMIPLYAAPHLDPVSDLLGLRWRQGGRLHASFGLMASSLLTFHLIVIQSTSQPFPLHKPQNIWAVIVSSLLILTPELPQLI